jgi:hypothetical protein
MRSARSAAVPWCRSGDNSKLLACAAYPECKSTREIVKEETSPKEGAAGQSRYRAGTVRKLRKADGTQAGPLRAIPRLHRLSGMQDNAKITEALVHPETRRDS